jgi:hypothetical protein
MALQTDPNPNRAAGLCRRNALHVLNLARTTHPLVSFDHAGVRWLDEYIEASRRALVDEMTTEFVQLMACFYGECLIAQFGGAWAFSGERLGIATEGLGYTYPFAAIEKHVRHGHTESAAARFFMAIEYLGTRSAHPATSSTTEVAGSTTNAA